MEVHSCGAVCPWRWTRGFAGVDNREQVHAQYHLQGYDEFVCPSNLRNIADYVLKWPFSHFHVLSTHRHSRITVP